MPFQIKQSALAVGLVLSSSALISIPAFANNSTANAGENIEDIEVITITNQRHSSLSHNESYANGKTSEPDLANWLASVPGANINSNGPITGIAQYRGLFGDRVAATIDGHPIVGAGPNAMDTPLSYSTPLIVESMTVYRGIAPVSAAMNTLGGAIDIKMRKAETSSATSAQTSGDVQAGYRGNNKAKTLSAAGNVAKNDLGVLVYANKQAGDSMKSGDGKLISPTDFDKTQLGTDVRYTADDSSVGLSYHYTKTKDSGTPALPMDIEYIESHRINLDGTFSYNDWQGEWLLGYLDADHGMTNFLMRANSMPDKHRRNNALAKTTDFRFTMERSFEFGDIEIGADGFFAVHDSVITNPNNAMFKVVNFNNVKDDRYAIFAQWQNTYDATNIQLGVRLKRADANAGVVSSSMAMMDMSGGMDMGGDMGMNSTMMPSMAELAMSLQDDFNKADRKVSDTNVDVSLSTQTKLSDPLSLYVGVGIKNRAPSYQERYLWTPMEATGGLADGHTYIGDINLKSETAYQADIGLTYQNDKFMISPHVFYQQIDNYIQGTPLTMDDMSAKMMASMMANDDSPLKFSNVDAKLYGLDLNWRYQVADSIQLSGIASYVKGERRDISDNLYRIAPLNGNIAISYFTDNAIANLRLVAASAQDNVSMTNNEKKTAGYGVVNIDIEYFVSNEITIRAGIDNLLDREYQNHLGGYNRVKETEIPVMSRLPSEGLSAWAEVTYSF